MKVIDGVEMYPLVPLAVGVYSTAFNIFNTVLLFPFTGWFERILSKIGHHAVEDKEDYSQPRFLDPSKQHNPALAVPAVESEINRYLGATGLFLATARGLPNAPEDGAEPYTATDILSREIRQYTAGMFGDHLPYHEADLVASLIEEADFAASLGNTLYQLARRIERVEFSQAGRKLVDEMLDQISDAMEAITGDAQGRASVAANVPAQLANIANFRQRCLNPIVA